jgi:prepilin-type N-terminal cleavage/methylation domain-containing protein
MRKKMQNDRGLSLLEVLICMLILAFGLLGLAPMFTMAIEGNVISRDTSVASDLIKDKIEYFEALDPLPSVPYTETETGLNGKYNRSTFINDHASDSTVPDSMYRLDVAVAWTDHQAVNRSATYSTYLIPKP